jgi:hypothetical protein
VLADFFQDFFKITWTLVRSTKQYELRIYNQAMLDAPSRPKISVHISHHMEIKANRIFHFLHVLSSFTVRDGACDLPDAKSLIF